MHDDAEARSQFGTKAYWDDMYRGLGDFDEEAYEWYFGWPDIKPYFQEHVHTTSKILIPGMGNDPLLLDLVGAGYGDITAFDYSEGAVARQAELLAYDANAEDAVTLLCRDARALDEAWTGAFDAILEKGCLDALYLSDDTDGCGVTPGTRSVCGPLWRRETRRSARSHTHAAPRYRDRGSGKCSLRMSVVHTDRRAHARTLRCARAHTWPLKQI